MTPLPLTEAQLLSKVITLAQAKGWLVHHCRPARTKDGWKTPISGDAGFCDLVLAKDGHVIFAELKSESGRLTRQQVEWLQNLEDGPGGHDHVLVRVWRPSDWAEIEKILS